MEPIRVMAKTIPADVYNHIRIAHLRMGSPLEFELARHRGLQFLIYPDLWHCLDTFSGNQTIMVWQSFVTNVRAALHEPVVCELSLYHKSAGLVMGSVLDELSDIIASRLQKQATDQPIAELL